MRLIDRLVRHQQSIVIAACTVVDPLADGQPGEVNGRDPSVQCGITGLSDVGPQRSDDVTLCGSSP